MDEGPVLRVEVEAASLADLRAFVDEAEPDLGCRPVPRRSESGFVIDVFISETRLDAARSTRAANAVSLRVVENATAVGLERQQEVGEGDRFAARGEVPRGLGSKE